MSNTHDKFLTGSPEKEEAFLRDLSTLLSRYSIDNAVNAPDYALANYLHGNLHTVRHILHMHHFPRGAARGYTTGAPYPWGPIAEELAGIEDTMELAKQVRAQLLEKGRPCYTCNGTGYLVPQAIGSASMQQWVDNMRKLNTELAKDGPEEEVIVHGLDMGKVGKPATLKNNDRPFRDNKSHLTDDGVRYDLPGQEGGQKCSQ